MTTPLPPSHHPVTPDMLRRCKAEEFVGLKFNNKAHTDTWNGIHPDWQQIPEWIFEVADFCALWLPISLAPRDGTWVEGYWANNESHYDVQWNGEDWVSRLRMAQFSPTHFRPLATEGREEECTCQNVIDPTCPVHKITAPPAPAVESNPPGEAQLLAINEELRALGFTSTEREQILTVFSRHDTRLQAR